MEGATGLCVSRTHYSVEFHHYLAKLVEADNTDATRIFRHYGVDTSKLTRELQVALDKMKRGNTGGPALSETIMELLKEAWSIGSLDYGAREIRTGFTVLALAQHEDLVAASEVDQQGIREDRSGPAEEELRRHRSLFAGRSGGRDAGLRRRLAKPAEPAVRSRAARRRTSTSSPSI